jgi:predicted Zn-dependent protease
MLIGSCARNPVTGRREIVLVSESQELLLGRESDVQVAEEYGVVEQPELQSYIRSVGGKLAAVSHRPALEWRFTVVDSPVVNAFAIPGGYIYFTRGILAYLNTEAELAGVMGHEITHVTARHSVRQITRSQLTQLGLGVGSILSPTFGQFGNIAESALGLMFLRFSRDDEREADRIGVEYTARAGYDPRQVSNFFEVLRRMSEAEDRETIPGWLSTHPDPPERVASTLAMGQEWIETLNLSEAQLIVNRDDHLRKLDGMMFGDNPREGFSDGRRFYHPDLAFQLVFPPDWTIENTRTAVLALDPQQQAQLQLTLADAPAGTTAEAYAAQLAANGVVPQSSERTVINGNRAFLALYPVQVEGGVLAAMVGFIEFQDRIFQIVGVTGNLQRYGSELEACIRSFNRLTDQRLLAAQPDRLRLYTAKQGDTLAAISQRLNNPRVDADDLAILNRLAIDQPIQSGRLIKTVEKGY